MAEVGFRPVVPAWAPPTEDYCGVRPGQREALRIGPEGGLANCVVDFPEVLASPQEASVGPEPMVDNRGCEFRPHVLLVRRGQAFRLHNSDPVFHNVNAHTVWGHYSRFNVGLAAGGEDHLQTEVRAGPLVLRCDAGHTWMRSYVYVTAGKAAALTDEAGRFEVAGLAPGTHRVRLWHEHYGRAEFLLKLPAPGAEGGEAYLERNFVAWSDSSPAFGDFAPGDPPPPRPPLRPVTPRVGPVTAAAASPAPRRATRRGPAGPEGQVPVVLGILWALGVAGAGGLLLVLRRARLSGGEAGAGPGPGPGPGGDGDGPPAA